MSGSIGSPCTTSRYTSFRTPWGLTVTINRALLPRFKAACNQAHSHPWKPRRIDSYVCRKIRGSSKFSRHAFAAAFDFFDKPFPQPVDVWGPTNAPPASFAAIFKRYGFSWGGDWSGRSDFPHIEWASSTVPAFKERSWFDMATKKDLREVVQAENKASEKRIRKMLNNHRKQIAVGASQKGYRPDNVNLKAVEQRIIDKIKGAS